MDGQGGGVATGGGAQGVGGGAGGGQAGREQRDPIINARDRLFHTLFFRISLAYARGCPRQVRRLIECVILIKAVVCMCMLVYIHLVYTRQPVQCLEHLADAWPRDGVLRVEIQRGGPTPGYDINTSYEKERRLALRQRELENLGSFFSIITGDLGYTEALKAVEEEEAETEEEVEQNEELVEQLQPPQQQADPPPQDQNYEDVLISNTSMLEDQEKISTLTSTLDYMKDRLHSLQEALKEEKEMTNERLDSISEYGQDIGAQASKLKTVIVNMTDELGVGGGSIGPEDGSVLEEKSDLEKLSRLVWAEDGYIIEYSLEIGFLRLSPATRQRLNIPVHIEILDPNTNACFGDAFSRFILENMLGYEDVLMSSVKTLAEKENNKGFLRNVVTGAQYHFKAKWTSVTSYIPAVLVMIVFTISISMLLRYSQHQIFVFIIDLLQMVELNTNITFPVAPLLTVILALVGMEAIMSEFFEDTTTAFYIILLVWLCDQYDSICCHTPITKRYWLRFFYLYHTAFYAYHYRFSGQYSGLALLTMWLFTKHSMIYFFHHYELPVILQQAQIRDILSRSNGQVHINFNNVTLNNNNNTTNNNNNNNNANVANNNVVRRILRPRFTLGRFQFRFVFQALHNPTPQQQQQQQQQAAATASETSTAATTTDNSSSSTAETTPSDNPAASEPGVARRSSLPAVVTPEAAVDPAAVQRYAAEVVESTREMEQLERQFGRLNITPPPIEDTLNRQDSTESKEEESQATSPSSTDELSSTQISTASQQPSVNCVEGGGDDQIVTDLLDDTQSSSLSKITDENTLLKSDSDVVVESSSGDDCRQTAESSSSGHESCNNKVEYSESSRVTTLDVDNNSGDISTTTTPVDQPLRPAADQDPPSVNGLRDDLREIRSDLAEAAREATELLRDLQQI